MTLSNSYRGYIIGAVLAVFCAAPAYAGSTGDPLIEGAKLCTKHLPRYEREYGIPTHLLSAIASTESGRYHEGLKIKVPWPWTINVNGKGYFFDTKAEAIAAAKKFKKHGIKSMDVGCMQVNIMHHANAFASLDEAFEPQTNIAYAAAFLRQLYQDDGSWKKAASDYHSKTPSLGKEYAGLVYQSWYTIIEKLRAARLAVPDSSVAALNDMKNDSGDRRVSTIPVSAQYTQPGAYQSPRMNSIKVTKAEARRDSSRENGIIVVRPDMAVARDAVAAQTQSLPTPSLAPAIAQSVPLTVAQNKDEEAIPAPVPEPNAKVVRLDNTKVITTPVKKSGPNFIFND